MCLGAKTWADVKQVVHDNRIELLSAPAISGGVQQDDFLLIIGFNLPGSRKIHNLMGKIFAEENLPGVRRISLPEIAI